MLLNRKLRFLDAIVLAGYVTTVFIAVVHHEPWSDEAQAWLIARDLPLGKMVSQMRYEVSPGLWHYILWVAQHVFHAAYPAMNWIGAAIAIAGAALLIFCAPFPRPVRYLMAFSYQIVYQYAVVARPYVLLLVFASAAAIFYRRRRLIPLAVSLALLCGVSVHGILLASAIAAGAAWREFVDRKNLDRRQQLHCVAALAIVLTAVIGALMLANPPRDIYISNPLKGGDISKLADTVADITLGSWFLGGCILLGLGAIAFLRREIVVFVLAVGGLLVFQSFFYGAPHHEGVIVIAIITSLWIAYPRPEEETEPWLRPAVFVALSAVFLVQTFWGVRALRYDYNTPYSGSADMAHFIEQTGAQPQEITAFGWSSVALQPYFSQDMFNNWPTAYVHHTARTEAPLAVAMWRYTKLTRYLVIASNMGDVDLNGTALIRHYGYKRIHVSPGRVLDTHGVWTVETYTLYEHVGNTPTASSPSLKASGGKSDTPPTRAAGPNS